MRGVLIEDGRRGAHSLWAPVPGHGIHVRIVAPNPHLDVDFDVLGLWQDLSAREMAMLRTIIKIARYHEGLFDEISDSGLGGKERAEYLVLAYGNGRLRNSWHTDHLEARTVHEFLEKDHAGRSADIAFLAGFFWPDDEKRPCMLSYRDGFRHTLQRYYQWESDVAQAAQALMRGSGGNA